jgi:hypothetical protein
VQDPKDGDGRLVECERLGFVCGAADARKVAGRVTYEIAMIAAPSVVWTPLPQDFVHESLAVVERTILLGGGGQYVGSDTPAPPAVLELTIADDRAQAGAFWDLPATLPSRPDAGPRPLDDAGPAMVSAASVGGGAVAVVMIRASADFPGCLGGWYHPLGSESWEYLGSASSESDIGANDRVGIGDRVLVTSDSESEQIFVLARSGKMDDVSWPGGAVTRTTWRHGHVKLPDGVRTSNTSDASISMSGRWIALRGALAASMRDCVLVYENVPGWSLTLRLDYPGFRVEATTITDAWLVVLESDNGVARLRWRRAITGEDRYLAIGQGRTTLDVLGDRALLTQDTRALVVDLARGVLTHNIQRGGASRLSNGKLAPGFAVFVEEGKIGVAAL